MAHIHKSNGHSNLKENLAAAISLLKGANYRITRPREILLEIILKQKSPFSSPILAELVSSYKGCDPVTVYRTLTVLEKLGIIVRCEFSDDMTFYEVAIGTDKTHHHHHVVCQKCHKVESLDSCHIEKQEKILEKLGYRNLSHRLEFTGICGRCSS